MTKKHRRTLRFGIGTLLVAIFFASLAFAWYANRKRQSYNQIQSVAFFNEHGVITIEDSELVQILEIPTSVNGDTFTIKRPAINKAGRKVHWLEPYLGEYMFARYSALQVLSRDRLDLQDMKTNLRKLPWLKVVFLENPNYSACEIEDLRRDFPNVVFEVWPEP